MGTIDHRLRHPNGMRVDPADPRAAALTSMKDRVGLLRERCIAALSQATLTADG